MSWCPAPGALLALAGGGEDGGCVRQTGQGRYTGPGQTGVSVITLVITLVIILVNIALCIYIYRLPPAAPHLVLPLSWCQAWVRPMLDTAAYCRSDTVTQSLATTLHSLRWSPGTNTV